MYRATDLGTFGGDFAQATGINDAGQVCGYAATLNDAAYHAFSIQNSKMVDLGTLGGLNSAAQGIAGAGQVAGQSQTQQQSHAFLYFLGSMIDLGTLGGLVSQAYDVNLSGTVVGVSSTLGEASQHAFAFYNGSMHDMGTLGGSYSQAFGISDSGFIVGVSETTGGLNQHAFLYSNGSMSDIGTLGGQNSYAYSVNASGQVVGDSYLSDNATDHAYLYSFGVMHDLGTLGGFASYATGIDNAGDVVGQAYLSDDATLHGFIFTSGSMIDLNSSLDGTGAGMAIVDAVEINNHGAIAANAVLASGENHAVLLTPYFVAIPTAYSIVAGQYVTGSLGSLFNRDGQYLVVKSGPTFSNGTPPLSIVLTSTSPISAPTDLRLVLVAHALSVDIGQTVELYDYVHSAWVLVGSQIAGTADVVQTAISSSPTRFVQSGTNQMMARLSWKPVGPISASPWTVSIDQAVWNVSP